MGPHVTDLQRLAPWVDEVHVVEVPMTTRFRGITTREAMIIRAGEVWTEWSPFPEYGPDEAATWWGASEDFVLRGVPDPVREAIPVNVTVPAESAEAAHARVLASGCTTAKVKVAESGQTSREDVGRVEAVRDALGGAGKVRVDANGAWTPDQALTMINQLRHCDLEYVEQPCRTVEELAALRRELARRGWSVRIAADESIRRSGDPERVVALDAADVAVIKVQPLGGVRACLDLVERLGLPVVVSSALETSVGLRLGLALAAALPELPFACGLNTGPLLARDVVREPLRAVGGVIAVDQPAATMINPGIDPEALTRLAATPETTQRWLRRAVDVLAAREDHASGDHQSPLEQRATPPHHDEESR